MSFAVPQDRARLSYSQTAHLPSFQLQQTARSSQPPTAPSFSFQPANLSHQHPHPHPLSHPHPHPHPLSHPHPHPHPHPHSHPHPHPHPHPHHPHPHPHPHSEGFLPISDRGKPSPVPRNESLSRPRPQENSYLLQLQESSRPPVVTQRPQPPETALSLPNGGNAVRAEPIEPQPAAAASDQDPSLEVAQMTRPPEGAYPTFEALLAGANQHAFSRGYAFVIGRSKKKNKLGLKKVLLSCDKGGTSHHKMLPADSDRRKRKTTTRKTGCEFGVYAIESQTEWTLKYRPDPACASHNHGPSKSVTEHPAARKLNSSAIAAVKAMKEAGISAQDTLKEIQRENPNTPLIARDVYNARAALRREPECGPAEPAVPNNASSGLQIYRRANMTPEERLRDDLRMEVTRAKDEQERIKDDCRKEIEAMKAQLKEKDKMIEKFEMFIDICNQRVMVQRERLDDDGPPGGSAGPA